MTNVWPTFTHPLKFPVPAIEGRDQVKEVTLREPDVDALEAIEAAGFEEGKKPTLKQVRVIITALSGLDDAIIGKLHRDDFTALGAHIVPLLVGAEMAAKLMAEAED